MFTHKSKLEKIFCENEGILFVQYFKHLFSVETKDSRTNNMSLKKERNQTSGPFGPSFHVISCVPFH